MTIDEQYNDLVARLDRIETLCNEAKKYRDETKETFDKAKQLFSELEPMLQPLMSTVDPLLGGMFPIDVNSDDIKMVR